MTAGWTLMDHFKAEEKNAQSKYTISIIRKDKLIKQWNAHQMFSHYVNFYSSK